MRIHLVLSDDWELHGEGYGDMRLIQVATLGRVKSLNLAHHLT